MPSDETPKKKATAKKKAATKKVAATKVAAKKAVKKTATPATRRLRQQKKEVEEGEENIRGADEGRSGQTQPNARNESSSPKTVAESKSEALSIFEKPARKVRKKKVAAADHRVRDAPPAVVPIRT